MESPACREGKGDARGYLASLTFQALPQCPQPVLPSLRPSGRQAPAPTLTASPRVISGSPSSELWGAVKIVSAFAGEENMFEGLPWRFSGKETACNAGDAGLILGLGPDRNPGVQDSWDPGRGVAGLPHWPSLGTVCFAVTLLPSTLPGLPLLLCPHHPSSIFFLKHSSNCLTSLVPNFRGAPTPSRRSPNPSA